MNRRAIQDAVRAAIVACVSIGVAVIHEHEGGPQPTLPFVAVNCWTASRRLGRPEARDGNEPGVVAHITQQRLTVAINVYGDGGLTIADSLADGLLSDAASAHLAPAGLAVIDVGDVRNLTFLDETNFRERAQFEVFILAASAWVENVGWIETVGVDGALITEGGDTIPMHFDIPEEG